MQLIEEAVDFPNPYDNSTACLIPVFDPMMTVLREQESYPIISFVADTGGILGLFIGFNFLITYGLGPHEVVLQTSLQLLFAIV